jgi:hypothetical protein
MLRFLIIISFVFSSCFLQAQEKIQTERLNQFATADVLKKGNWQVAAGIQYTGTSRGFYNQLYLQSPLIQQRYGISDKMEIRFALSNGNVFARNHGSLSSNYYLSGIEAPVIGTKIKILEQQDWIPQLSILSEVSLKPLASQLFRGKNIRPNLQLLLAHELSDKLKLGYNLGSFWNRNFYFSYDFYLQKKWGEHWISNIEYSGYTSKMNETRTNKMSNLFASLGYYISPNVIGDIGLGRGVGNRPDYLIQGGLSFNLR